MSVSHDVTLPRNIVPRFPDRCPCSGQPGPGKAVRLSFVGYYAPPRLVDYVIQGVPAGGNTLDYVVVPASEACGRRLRRYHFWIKVAKYLTWAPLFFGLLLWTGNTTISVIALLAGLIVPVIWEVMNPPAFGATPRPDKITYEFRSREYAEEFARLNETVLDGTKIPVVAPKA